MQDFMFYFDRLHICHLSPDMIESELLKSLDAKTWEVAAYVGSWVAGVSAGGNRKNHGKYSVALESFCRFDDPSIISIAGQHLESRTETVASQKHSRRIRDISSGWWTRTRTMMTINALWS